MKQILAANENVLRILRKPRDATHDLRMISYCVSLEVESGMLLLNTLTKEMILLTMDEYSNRMKSDYLRSHWFLIPTELNEKELVKLVRLVCSNINNSKCITNYTILTTTDCNARCFYCYELGLKRKNMSEKTALTTADYIIDHCGKEKVHITWFGGEPLYNAGVINTICNKLSANGVNFESFIVSNAYLFNKSTAQTAAKHWHLKRAQITLDGTEETYNHIKAFIYKDSNPYQIVMQNISNLMDEGIAVTIRLNMDLNNISSLTELVDELSARFPDKELLSIYPHLIFDENSPTTERFSSDELSHLYDALWHLQEKIDTLGFALPKRNSIKTKLRLTSCMADNDNSVVITPSGHIGICEHHSEDELIGHIDEKDLDQAIIASWKLYRPEIPECNNCFCYPDCIKLKKCPNKDKCYEQIRTYKKKAVEHAMLQEYLRWQNKK